LFPEKKQKAAAEAREEETKEYYELSNGNVT